MPSLSLIIIIIKLRSLPNKQIENGGWEQTVIDALLDNYYQACRAHLSFSFNSSRAEYETCKIF